MVSYCRHKINMFLIFLAFFLQIILVASIRMQKVKLQTLNLESENYFNYKVWQHEGYFHPSVTQIFEKLNISVNHSSPNLLMSIGTSAILQTKLKNHDHTFLGIKFSAIIGKISSQPMASTTKSPTTTTKTISTTTKSVESIDSSKLTTRIQAIAVQKQRLSNVEVNQINNVVSENDSVVYSAGVKDDTSSGNKNNADSKTETEDEEKSEGETGVRRRKRDVQINSQELLQIHRIFKLAKKTVSEDKKTDTLIATTKLPQDSAFSATTTESSINNKSNSKPSDEASNNQKQQENTTEDVKLSYKSWRASFDKSYRPPGFYLLVDNQVIFDNWVGVWYKTNVMGKTSPYSPKRLWNETEIQFQWDEPMDKEINVSFEWEPMDHNSYILIDNIELYTYEAHTKEESISDVPKKLNEKISVGGNGNVGETSHNNVTVYIVLKSNAAAEMQTSTAPTTQNNNIIITSTSTIPKSDIVHTQTSDKSNADVKVVKEVNEARTNESDKGINEFPSNKLTNELLELIKIVKNLSDKGNKNETANHKNTTKIGDAGVVDKKVNQTLKSVNNNITKIPSKFKTLSEDKTALVVLIMVTVLSFVTLVVLIHNKMKKNKNPNRKSARASIN